MTEAYADSQQVYRTRALGTVAELVTDASALFEASELLELELERIDRVASRFRSDSDLSRLNASTGSEVVVGHDLFEAIDVALAMAAATDGLVDPTVGEAMNRLGYDRDFSDVVAGVDGDLPPERAVPGWRSVSVERGRHAVRLPVHTALDLGATAKALAADRAAATIHSRLGCGVLVSLGGDAATGGPAPAGGFVIGIADTCTSPAPDETVAISSGGLATSGIGMRSWRLGKYGVHHIVDPATGLPAAPCWRTVSVAAANCVQANAASTAAIVLGERAVDWLEDHALPARLVRLEGTVVYTEGWPIPEPGLPRAGVERPMTASVVATVGHGSTALWYLTRATGLVSLILLSATVVLGTVASVGWTSDRWPRFLSQSLHRNLSLFCIILVGVHVVTTVGDGYVPIGLADAVIPFRSPYRPIWVGLGAVAFDMLLAVAITERAAPPHWRGCLAGSPLARLRLLAHCRAPRLGLRLRRPASGGADRVRALRRRCRRRSGLAAGRREGALGDLATRRRRCRRRGTGGHRGLRCRRSAPARLVASGRYLLRPPGRVVRLRLVLVLLCAPFDHTLHHRPARLGHPERPLRDDRVGNGRLLSPQW